MTGLSGCYDPDSGHTVVIKPVLSVGYKISISPGANFDLWVNAFANVLQVLPNFIWKLNYEAHSGRRLSRQLSLADLRKGARQLYEENRRLCAGGASCAPLAVSLSAIV